MTDTCQVDFYVLSSDNQTAERLACRLALMAWEQGKQIAVLAENADEVQKLDALMWDYPPGRFLPHSTNFSDPSAPVRIAASGAEFPDDCEVLINLTSAAIPDLGKFKRLLEIVPGGESDRAVSRHKFRAYRDLGLQPASHTIGK